MTPPPNPDLLTGGEVASLLRVSRSTVARWGKDGLLHPIRAGRQYRYRRSEIEALLEDVGAPDEEAAS